MLQIKCEKDHQKEMVVKRFIPFFIEVKEDLGLDILQCQSFEEFKRKFLEKMTNAELFQALQLPNNSLRKETLEELKRRGIEK